MYETKMLEVAVLQKIKQLHSKLSDRVPINYI